MSYISDLEQKLKDHQRRYDEITEQLLSTSPLAPNFDQLVTERNAITVDIATIRDRIYYHDKPGSVVEVQF